MLAEYILHSRCELSLSLSEGLSSLISMATILFGQNSPSWDLSVLFAVQQVSLKISSFEKINIYFSYIWELALLALMPSARFVHIFERWVAVVWSRLVSVRATSSSFWCLSSSSRLAWMCPSLTMSEAQKKANGIHKASWGLGLEQYSFTSAPLYWPNQVTRLSPIKWQPITGWHCKVIW